MTIEQRTKNDQHNMPEFSLIDVSGNLTNLKYEHCYQNDQNDSIADMTAMDNEQKNE